MNEKFLPDVRPTLGRDDVVANRGECENLMRKVIAHYSFWRALFSAIVCFIVAGYAVYMPLWFDGGHVIGFARSPGHRSFLLPVLLVAWLCAAFTLLVGLAILCRILFDGASALWIEGDELVFLHRWIFAAKCSEVDAVTAGKSGMANSDAIILKMWGGRQKTSATTGLKESREAIICQLERELRLLTT